MSRERQIAKALKWRDEGLTYQQISERLGVSVSTVKRWVRPDLAAADRAAVRAYKARNREKLRKYDAEYDRSHRATCPNCGAEVDRRHAERGSKRCASCLGAEIDARAKRIERWWAEGLSCQQIAQRLGWTEGHVQVEIHCLRSKGYHLPYRRATGKRAGSKFPEQVVA